MPLPLLALPVILKIGAVIAATTGAGVAIKGGVDMKKARDTVNDAQNRHDSNLKRFQNTNTTTAQNMDTLGKTQMEILASFGEFSDLWEKIHNRPNFSNFSRDNVKLSTYSPKKLKEVSFGANVLLGALGGSAAGTAGGFAAAGATTAAVAALGTASTGTVIASLSGVAATNAALVSLGGGALASTTIVGTTVLGVTTLGVGLLVGGVVFAIAGKSGLNKADEAYNQMIEAEKIIDDTCAYLVALQTISQEYYQVMMKCRRKYLEWLNSFKQTLNYKTNWNDFSQEEKLNAENLLLSVGLLSEMCDVKLVLVSNNVEGVNTINYKEINEVVNKVNTYLP